MCFFAMTHLPPTSPLFPYATLFRSVIVHHVEVEEYQQVTDGPHTPEPDDFDAESCSSLSSAHRGHQANADEKNTDRKSTRLNSSHEWISYAVFCLKKKTNCHVAREA